MRYKLLEDIINSYERDQLSFSFPEVSLIRKNKYIYKLDNGFLLDFDYSSSDIRVKAYKAFLTEGELEVGVHELELEFDNKLREKQQKEKSESTS